MWQSMHINRRTKVDTFLKDPEIHQKILLLPASLGITDMCPCVPPKLRNRHLRFSGDLMHVAF